MIAGGISMAARGWQLPLNMPAGRFRLRRFTFPQGTKPSWLCGLGRLLTFSHIRAAEALT